MAGNWLERLAPDAAATFRRFPLAILCAGLALIVVLGAMNGPEWMRDEVWSRAAVGLMTAAVFATAGVLFEESRPEARRAAFILKYLVPVAAGLSLEILDSLWFLPWAMPAISLLWLSVSPTTRIGRGPVRTENENRFWWINHRAVATAAIAAIGFLVICIGVVAIERALGTLFHIEAGKLFYQGLLPIAGLFLTPVYWLSTIPRPSDYDPRQLAEPDFLAPAIGFLGQFVLVPLLLLYALILLAYAAQIVVTRSFPQGTIGWMVLGFVVAGAACWLLLHPAFMRQRLLVRLFRRWWFWLTLIPLGLALYALWLRIDAYGLTPERLLLATGFLWAILIAVLFLAGRGDIRLIPGLAGALLLLMSIGPWNFEYLSATDQLNRLGALLKAGPDPKAPKWTGEQQASAWSAATFLADPSDRERRLAELLARSGIAYDPASDSGSTLMQRLGQIEETARIVSVSLYRDALAQAVDVSATPFLVERIESWGGARVTIGVLRLDLDRDKLWISALEGEKLTSASVPIPQLAASASGRMAAPAIDFGFGGTGYRIVLDQLEFTRRPGGTAAISHLSGTLFADQAPTPSP